MSGMLPEFTKRELWQHAAKLAFFELLVAMVDEGPYQRKDLSGIVCLATTKQCRTKEVKHEA